MLKLNSLFAGLLILLPTLYSVPALAEEELPVVPDLQIELDEIDIGEAISPLKLGQQAPFTGVLFSPAAVAKITVDVKNINKQIAIEVDKANKLCSAESEFNLNNLRYELDSSNKIAEIKLNASLKENNVLVNRIKKLEKSQDNTIWLIGGGFLAGTLITSITISLVK